MGTERSRSRPRVLIVDDEQETCVLLQAHLEESNIDVVGLAFGGASAISLALALQPDVVLMDVRMPEVNGLEATRLIKEADPQVQIILLTFYDDIDWSINVERAGAFCYLLKGCPPSMIVDMVQRAWEYKRDGHTRATSAG